MENQENKNETKPDEFLEKEDLQEKSEEENEEVEDGGTEIECEDQ